MESQAHIIDICGGDLPIANQDDRVRIVCHGDSINSKEFDQVPALK